MWLSRRPAVAYRWRLSAGPHCNRKYSRTMGWLSVTYAEKRTVGEGLKKRNVKIQRES